jgi:VIT1/CCC1 family predicted Fe2+/Mn2+ transporter
VKPATHAIPTLYLELGPELPGLCLAKDSVPSLGGSARQDEHEHYSQRAPALRAFILGAVDGLVSVSALMLGVAGGMDDLNAM